MGGQLLADRYQGVLVRAQNHLKLLERYLKQDHLGNKERSSLHLAVLGDLNEAHRSAKVDLQFLPSARSGADLNLGLITLQLHRVYLGSNGAQLRLGER